MEEAKELEKRVSDLEDYVQRLAILIAKVAKTPRQPSEFEQVRAYNPVENTK